MLNILETDFASAEQPSASQPRCENISSKTVSTHEWYVLPLKTGFTGSFFQFQSGQLEGRTDPLISQAAEALVVGQLAAHHFKVLRADEL